LAEVLGVFTAFDFLTFLFIVIATSNKKLTIEPENSSLTSISRHEARLDWTVQVKWILPWNPKPTAIHGKMPVRRGPKIPFFSYGSTYGSHYKY